MPPMSRACRSGASLLEPGHRARQKGAFDSPFVDRAWYEGAAAC